VTIFLFSDGGTGKLSISFLSARIRVYPTLLSLGSSGLTPCLFSLILLLDILVLVLLKIGLSAKPPFGDAVADCSMGYIFVNDPLVSFKTCGALKMNIF